MELTTQICIIGAGPAGVVLGNLLLQQGLECIIVEARGREEIAARGRAGAIESTTVALLDRHGLADTIFANGLAHDRVEFRRPGFSVLLEYGKLVGGEVHRVYPQNLLVDDLIGRYLDAGGTLLFGTSGRAIHQDDDIIRVDCYDTARDSRVTISGEYAIGCDGFHGLSRTAIPPGAVETYDKQYAYAWLAILARARPSTEHIIYARHPDGFAGHMLRTSEISRYYLQIPPDEGVDRWPDARVWAALHTRLAKEGWRLSEGAIVEKRKLSLQSRVTEPMRHRRLFLAGDAAHIVPPLGGKGMNLAIHDAGTLAETLGVYYREGRDPSSLDRYSALRLPHIWRAQEFSHAMLQLLHLPLGEESGEARFARKLQEARLRQLATPSTFARDFARNYVGII